jgi:hypothetical protein
MTADQAPVFRLLFVEKQQIGGAPRTEGQGRLLYSEKPNDSEMPF